MSLVINWSWYNRSNARSDSAQRKVRARRTFAQLPKQRHVLRLQAKHQHLTRWLGSSTQSRRRTRAILDLLSAPPRIGVPHVCWGLDRRDELENDVADADDADDGARHVLNPAVGKDNGADEDVN